MFVRQDLYLLLKSVVNFCVKVGVFKGVRIMMLLMPAINLVLVAVVSNYYAPTLGYTMGALGLQLLLGVGVCVFYYDSTDADTYDYKASKLERFLGLVYIILVLVFVVLVFSGIVDGASFDGGMAVLEPLVKKYFIKLPLIFIVVNVIAVGEAQTASSFRDMTLVLFIINLIEMLGLIFTLLCAVGLIAV